MSEIRNFFTFGAAITRQGGGVKIQNPFKILLVGGAVVNLIPKEVVSELGVGVGSGRGPEDLHGTGDMLPTVTSCTLLLGRRWLKQAKARGEEHTQLEEKRYKF